MHDDFETWPERWTVIEDFPMYSISTLKRVRNDKRGIFISPRDNYHGTLMIKLYRNNRPYYRSLEKTYRKAWNLA